MKRFNYRLSVTVQGILWLLGISIHNRYANECCPDFSCCVHNIKKEPFLSRLHYLISAHKNRKENEKFCKEEI